MLCVINDVIGCYKLRLEVVVQTENCLRCGSTSKHEIKLDEQKRRKKLDEEPRD